MQTRPPQSVHAAVHKQHRYHQMKTSNRTKGRNKTRKKLKGVHSAGAPVDVLRARSAKQRLGREQGPPTHTHHKTYAKHTATPATNLKEPNKKAHRRQVTKPDKQTEQRQGQ